MRVTKNPGGERRLTCPEQNVGGHEDTAGGGADHLDIEAVGNHGTKATGESGPGDRLCFRAQQNDQSVNADRRSDWKVQQAEHLKER